MLVVNSFLRRTAVRFPVVVLAALAWFAVSNHCALAAIEMAAKPVAAVSHCHPVPAEKPAPTKGAPSAVECCKILRATLLTPAKNPAAFDHWKFTSQEYAVALLVLAAPRLAQLPLELDTGPPFALSFAESVLHRSLLAHAPPLLV
jgi:hypothetical protein